MSNTVSYLCSTLVRWKRQEAHRSLLFSDCPIDLTFAWQGGMLGKVDTKDTDEYARTRRLHQVRGLHSHPAYTLSSGVYLCSPKTWKEEQRNLHCSRLTNWTPDARCSTRKIGQNKDGLSRPISVAKPSPHVWSTTDDGSSSRYHYAYCTLPCGNSSRDRYGMRGREWYA